MKKSILQLTGEPVGGIRRHVHSILNNLNKDEFDIYYIYSNLSVDAIFQDDFVKIQPKLRGFAALPIKKLPCLNDIVNIVKIIIFLKKNNISLVHGHGAKGGLYARLIKIFCRVKVVYTPHGGVLHNNFKFIENLLFVLVERLLRFLTDVFIFESNFSRTSFYKKIGDPIRPAYVNYNGVDRASIKLTYIFPPQLLSNDNGSIINIGVFARLHYMKGQDLAINMMLHLPNFYHLHLFGDGPEKDGLIKASQDLNVSDRVHFHGDINNPEEIMQKLSCVLVPSRFESFSYVAAEAIMMGVPVVAASIGGLKEVIANNSGVLVRSPTPEKFAKSIKSIITNPLLKDELIKNGKRRYVEHFNEKVMINKLISIYTDLS